MIARYVDHDIVQQRPGYIADSGSLQEVNSRLRPVAPSTHSR